MVKRFRRNKKGFSLVELIIVIAIMVALIAVMAPNFVKYVKTSHDAVVKAAAEDCLTYIKTEMGNGTFTGHGVIKVHAPYGTDEKRHIKIEWVKDDPAHPCTLSYSDEQGRTGEIGFSDACGVDSAKTVKSDLVYLITIGETVSAHPDEVPIDVVTTNTGD